MKEEFKKYIWSIDNRKELRELFELLRAKSKELEQRQLYSFNVRDKVSFKSRSGKKVIGTIEKINRSTISVKTDIGGYRVSPSLLTKEVA